MYRYKTPTIKIKASLEFENLVNLYRYKTLTTVVFPQSQFENLVNLYRYKTCAGFNCLSDWFENLVNLYRYKILRCFVLLGLEKNDIFRNNPNQLKLYIIRKPLPDVDYMSA